MTAASARRAISMRPSVPTARKICSSLPRPVIRAVASANAPIAVTTPSPAIVPQSAARLLRLRPCTTKTETAMTPRHPKIVATSGSLPPRSAGTTARRNTATLDASPASAARPLRRATTSNASTRIAATGTSAGRRTISRIAYVRALPSRVTESSTRSPTRRNPFGSSARRPPHCSSTTSPRYRLSSSCTRTTWNGCGIPLPTGSRLPTSTISVTCPLTTSALPPCVIDAQAETSSTTRTSRTRTLNGPRSSCRAARSRRRR